MSFFTHSTEKGPVPALRAVKTGNMYKYINSDLQAILARSSRVTSICVDIADGVRRTTIRRADNE